MNGEKKTNTGPVEQEIISMMEIAGDEIMDQNQNGSGAREDEISVKIHMVNLSRCIIYLARQIDKLARS